MFYRSAATERDSVLSALRRADEVYRATMERDPERPVAPFGMEEFLVEDAAAITEHRNHLRRVSQQMGTRDPETAPLPELTRDELREQFLNGKIFPEPTVELALIQSTQTIKRETLTSARTGNTKFFRMFRGVGTDIHWFRALVADTSTRTLLVECARIQWQMAHMSSPSTTTTMVSRTALIDAEQRFLVTLLENNQQLRIRQLVAVVLTPELSQRY